MSPMKTIHLYTYFCSRKFLAVVIVLFVMMLMPLVMAQILSPLGARFFSITTAFIELFKGLGWPYDTLYLALSVSVTLHPMPSSSVLEYMPSVLSSFCF